jgi:quercetin dioxygenase-like cupin family protein
VAAIRFADSNDLVWMKSTDEPEAASREVFGKLTDQERSFLSAIHHLGSERDLQLFEVQVQPGAGTAVHAHAESEIIYVVAGEIKMGGRTVKAGSSVFIEAGTLYSFTAGPEGLRFLNFRPRRDDSYIPKDELLGERLTERHANDDRTR